MVTVGITTPGDSQARLLAISRALEDMGIVANILLVVVSPVHLLGITRVLEDMVIAVIITPAAV